MPTRLSPERFFTSFTSTDSSAFAAAIMVSLLAISTPTFAQEADELAEDSETISLCLKRANPDNRASCIGAVANPCLELPEGQSTHGMAQCHRRETKVWDARLNARYKKLMATLSPAAAKGLREAQRAWMAYRNAYCKAVILTYEGGSMGTVSSAYCHMDLTAHQALRLERIGFDKN
jgi:uncharacterized protein YecT (DUF1311 family)